MKRMIWKKMNLGNFDKTSVKTGKTLVEQIMVLDENYFGWWAFHVTRVENTDVRNDLEERDFG